MWAVPIEAAKEQIIGNEPASHECNAVARLSSYYLEGVSLSSASFSPIAPLLLLFLIPLLSLPSAMLSPSHIHPLKVFPNRSSHLFLHPHLIFTFTSPLPSTPWKLSLFLSLYFNLILFIPSIPSIHCKQRNIIAVWNGVPSLWFPPGKVKKSVDTVYGPEY